jgi:ethanolamine ammonia-lyase small subunit
VSLPDANSLWARLRAVTPARIGLARSGSAVDTRTNLAFQLDHARAKDAVHAAFDTEALVAGLAERRWHAIKLHSAATSRSVYLARPDLGRRLDQDSRDRLQGVSAGHDLVFVLTDGLSARAVTSHAVPLLDHVIPSLLRESWKIGPVAVVGEGRVAIGDEIGSALGASIVVVLIGERPGLTSPDSLGAYLTWHPEIGRTDAERNCLSNIRPEGLSYAEAARRLFYLCTQARRRGYTGVALKDESDVPSLEG